MALFDRLLVLGLRPAVVDDTPARLDRGDAVLEHDRANSNGCLHVAAEAEIAQRPGVGAALILLQFGDDLHGPDLGGAGHRPGGESGADRVEAVPVRAHPALDMGDHVHDVTVALHLHQLRHPYRPRQRHPADIVAAEVQEHGVLGPLLFVGEEFGLQARIFVAVGAAAAGAGDGVRGHLALLHHHQQFRGGADDLVVVHLQVIGVGRGVYRAQGAVDVEGVGEGGAGEALGKDALNDVAGDDVVDDAADVGLIVGAIPCWSARPRRPARAGGDRGEGGRRRRAAARPDHRCGPAPPGRRHRSRRRGGRG